MVSNTWYSYRQGEVNDSFINLNPNFKDQIAAIHSAGLIIMKLLSSVVCGYMFQWPIKARRSNTTQLNMSRPESTLSNYTQTIVPIVPLLAIYIRIMYNTATINNPLHGLCQVVQCEISGSYNINSTSVLGKMGT